MGNYLGPQKKQITWLVGFVFLILNFAAIAQETEYKIQSDTSRYELSNNSVQYQGNARFVNRHFKLSGELINAISAAEDSTQIKVSGKPAELISKHLESNQEFQFSAFNINYHLGNELLLAQTQIDLNIINAQGDRFIIKGDKLKIGKVPNGKLHLTGSPVILTITPKGKAPISAQSNSIVYDQQKELFELTGDTQMKTARETIKAQKIRYDAKLKLSIFPSQISRLK
ncbi:MAG: hypothetical protein OQK04_15640 [Kangiellaceae bacterium]|nr:hypothetical protein [Kangiellaceae bacterium]